MVDRHDIDALLIGALYGELTPAEEATLAAHLESHPADRTALADLTHTRQAVRDSKFFALQLDPPKAVSALLIQEAARRAPKRTEQEKVGWFQRFAQSFLRHPAMAAAAMLVIVVSVAGTIYSRKGDTFSETPAPTRSVAQQDMPVQNAQAPAAQPADDRGGQGAAPGPAKGDKLEADKLEANAESYRVDLATKNELDGKKADHKPSEPTVAAPVTGNNNKDSGERVRDGDLAKATAPQHGAKHSRPSGIEVNGRPTPAPMDFEGSKEQQAAPEPRAEIAQTEESTLDMREGRTASAGGGGTATAVPAAPPTADTANGLAPTTTPAPKAPAPARPVARPPSNTAPPPPPPAAHTTTDRRPQDKTVAAPGRSEDEKVAPDKTGEKSKDDAVLQWAKEQHLRVVDAVRRNNCPAAASIAVNIFRSAPDYYRENVATDRSLKSCLAYINREQDKELERARAAKAKALQQNDAAPTQRH